MNVSRFIAPACMLALWAGCDPSAEDNVDGRAVSIDRRTQALLGTDLLSVNGTYGAGCTNRSGSWSLEIASGATLDNSELSVVRNDAACALTMTELRTTGGLLSATPAFTLGTSYQGSASSFGSPIEFYANARADSLSFADDFVITVLYSDDSELASGSNTATFTVQTATVSAQSVDAPDYTLNVSGLLVQTDVDDVVQSASGTAELTAVSVSGTTYVVVDASGLDTYAELDAAYLGATSAAFTTSIAASDFNLVGDDLTTPQVRTLIIARIENGVRAYQAFEVTFNPPTTI